MENQQSTTPSRSFYQLADQLNDGHLLDFADLRGRPVLLVNTASNCGYTNQYAELQQLAERYADKLMVLSFPANDLAEQEQANDQAIQQFCQRNFGVSFPLMKKSVVVPRLQHPVYQRLTQASQNGWYTQPPAWNFAKYLVGADGRLLAYFDPAISPLDSALLRYL